LTVVVTGAAGFVGNNLVHELLAAGREVRAVVRRNRAPLDGLDVEIVQADVGDSASLVAAFEGAELVIHTVAVISLLGDPQGLVHQTNVLGAENAARAALQAGVKRYVHVSSCHAYDVQHHPITEDSPRPGPGFYAYDRSKAAGEAAVRQVVEEGLDAVIINPAGVLGLRDYGPSELGGALIKMSRRTLPTLLSGAFHWVDVRDVARGAMLAAETGITGRGYLLASEYLSIGDLADLVCDATGARPPRFTCPMWLARATGPFVDLAARMGLTPMYTSEALAPLRASSSMECRRARDELGWEPIPIAQSIRDLFAWRAEQGLT
jgi:dihydroflavonol-4-reductase